MKKIAVAIFNIIQFYSLEYGLDELIKRKYDVDIYIPDFVPDDITGDSGYIDIYNDTYQFVSNKGYTIKRKYNGEKYKLALTPYYAKNFFDFDTKYNVKYLYGVDAKPNITLKLLDNLDFDAVLCYTTFEKEYMSNYGMSFNIGNTKFYNFKKSKKNNKKKIYYFYQHMEI